MLVIGNKFNSVGSRDTYKDDFPQLLTEGAKELDVLCPVSKLTGFPMSMQQAIMLITDGNDRIADALFQEIPAIKYDDSIDDTDKLKTLVSRLDSGSFFENDKAAEILGDIAKEFFPSADVDKVVDDAKITFNKEDAYASQS